MIKAVIFDYDETLVKMWEARTVAYVDFAWAEYKQKLAPEKVRQSSGMPYEKFIEALYGQVEPVEKIIEKYQKFSANYPPIAYEGAAETVNSLFKKYLVGIVSGVRRKGLQQDMSKLDFDQKGFFHIQCGDDMEVLKPDPRVFESLLTKLKLCKIEVSEVVYVGDDLKDLAAAKAVGFGFIGMAGHTRPAEEFTKAGAETARSFEELEIKIKTQ